MQDAMLHYMRIDFATQGLTGKAAAMKLLGEAGIPARGVLDTDELNKEVTFERRGIMQTMIHPVHRPSKMPGWPVRVDGKVVRITSSPMLGEHTDKVLSDWLDLTATPPPHPDPIPWRLSSGAYSRWTTTHPTSGRSSSP